jgi:hypothetical protein
MSRAAAGGSGILLAALPLLLYTYLPRPPVTGAHLFVFPIMAATLGVLVLFFITKSPAVSRVVMYLLLGLLLLTLAVVASFILNASEIRTGALLELIRPASLGIFLLFGFYCARWVGPATVERGLLLAAYIILGGQAIIALTQVLDLPVFDLMYSSEKSRPLGTTLRTTGSLANPNAFAWIVAQATAIVLILRARAFPFWIALGGLLVLAAGSRTMLLLFPLLLGAAALWSRPQRLTTLVSVAILSAGALVGLVALVVSFRQYFPYLAQLHTVLLTGSLTSVNAIAARVLQWEAVWEAFDVSGPLTWLFGLGSRDLLRVVDNDFIFVLARLGVVGFTIHVGLLCALGTMFRRAMRADAVAVIGLHYLTFALVFGLVSDTLGGWYHPLPLFYYAGLTLGTAQRGWSPYPAAVSIPGTMHAGGAAVLR